MKKNILAKLSPFHFLMLLIAGIINAIGVTLFIAPVQLYDSGISGTSILLSQLTPDYLSLSFFLILLNIPLLLFGFKRQGAVFSIYAIFTVCVYSVAAWLITDVLPIDVSIASPLAGTDLFLCALFGGIISGVGSGLAIRYGGAMDGMDALLATVQMPSGIPVATVALNGAKNAAWLAAEILALSDDTLAGKLEAERVSMAQQIAAKEEKLQNELKEL